MVQIRLKAKIECRLLAANGHCVHDMLVLPFLTDYREHALKLITTPNCGLNTTQK